MCKTGSNLLFWQFIKCIFNLVHSFLQFLISFIIYIANLLRCWLTVEQSIPNIFPISFWSRSVYLYIISIAICLCYLPDLLISCSLFIGFMSTYIPFVKPKDFIHVVPLPSICEDWPVWVMITIFVCFTITHNTRLP